MYLFCLIVLWLITLNCDANAFDILCIDLLLTNNNSTAFVDSSLSIGWWSGVVVSALTLINEVNQRRARLVLRWATVSGFNSRCRTFISVYKFMFTFTFTLPWLHARLQNSLSIIITICYLFSQNVDLPRPFTSISRHPCCVTVRLCQTCLIHPHLYLLFVALLSISVALDKVIALSPNISSKHITSIIHSCSCIAITGQK